MSNSKCVFCDKGSFAHQVVAENEFFYVIHARRPLSRGHCLVIPKSHQDGLGIDTKSGLVFVSTVKRLFQALNKAFSSDGINFFANFGKAAGQEIAHAHFHVVPRYAGEEKSPFQILNNRKLHKSLTPLQPDILKREIEEIRENF